MEQIWRGFVGTETYLDASLCQVLELDVVFSDLHCINVIRNIAITLNHDFFVFCWYVMLHNKVLQVIPWFIFYLEKISMLIAWEQNFSTYLYRVMFHDQVSSSRKKERKSFRSCCQLSLAEWGGMFWWQFRLF